MTRTVLNLLTRDGAIAVTFEDTLTPEEYEAVYQCVSGVENAAEMKQCLQSLAKIWDMEVVIDDAV